MRNRTQIVALASTAALLFAGPALGQHDHQHAPAKAGDAQAPAESTKPFAFVGSQSYLVGDPAGADRFQYDGENINFVSGGIVATLDPAANAGNVTASFFYNGDEYRVVQTKMDRVVTNVELHGNTGMGPAVLPKVFTYVATFGPATVWKNGKVLYENIPGHLMLTESVRDEATHTVDFRGPRNVDSYPGSVANPNDTQVHFVVHTEEKAPGKFPPDSWFLHFMSDVVVTN